jgi:hypothetical protein
MPWVTASVIEEGKGEGPIRKTTAPPAFTGAVIPECSSTNDPAGRHLAFECSRSLKLSEMGGGSGPRVARILDLRIYRSEWRSGSDLHLIGSPTEPRLDPAHSPAAPMPSTVPRAMPWTIAPRGRTPIAYVDRSGMRAVDRIVMDHNSFTDNGSVDVMHDNVATDHRAVDMTYNLAVVAIPAIAVPPACSSGSRIGGSADHQECQYEDVFDLG